MVTTIDPFIGVKTTRLMLQSNFGGITTFLPAATSQNTLFLFPPTAGSAGQVLSTDGSGNLSWITVTGTGSVTSVSTTLSGLTVATSSTTPVIGGTLGVASGGTGATTASAALNALLPSQTGNSNKFLTTNGAGVISWGAPVGTGTVTSVSTTLSGLTVTTSTTTPVIGGTLGVSSGGTGATTATLALNNLLPSQSGNANKFLTTNGAGVISWANSTSVPITIGTTPLLGGSPSGVLLNTAGILQELPAGSASPGSGVVKFGSQIAFKPVVWKVSTVFSDLRALDPASASCAEVLGYYAEGDGGGGTFYSVTTGGPYTDNGGTIITLGGVTTTSAWIRSVNNSISVKNFGAKGDGVTDDTLAVTRTITYANSFVVSEPLPVTTIKYPGMCVVVPDGTYKLTSLASTINILCNVDATSSSIFLVPNAYASTVLKLGYDAGGTLLAQASIALPAVIKANGSSIVAGSVGVRIVNVNNSRIILPRIDYFDVNLWCGGKSQGTVYNQIDLPRSIYGNIHLKLQPETGGWCNTNNFYSGWYAQYGAKSPSRYHIYADGTASGMLGNNFFGLSLEGTGAGNIGYFTGFYNNNFFGIYQESGAAFVNCTVSGSTLTTVSAHNLSVGDMVLFIATTYPTGMIDNTPYWVVGPVAANTFSVSRSKGGTAVNFATSGSGVKFALQEKMVFNTTGGACSNNIFYNVANPPSTLIDFVCSGQALSNGYAELPWERYAPSEAPIFYGRNTYTSSSLRPVFAAFAPASNPQTNPLGWTTALSDLGVLFASNGNLTARWTSGVGSPQNVVTAPPGSLYTNTSGGAGTTLYVKESGTGNTGWVAK